MQDKNLKRCASQGEGEEEDGNAKKRKRQREKERRGALTDAFGELAVMIASLDNGNGYLEAGFASTSKFSARADGGEGDSLSRLEMLRRSLAIMDRQARENEELGKTVAQLRESIERKRDEARVIVPGLAPTCEVRSSQYAPYYSSCPSRSGYAYNLNYGAPPPTDYHAPQAPSYWGAHHQRNNYS